MKLIEKKCPNCGANLSFNDTDKSCKCEYCKREFEIERDEKTSNDNYNLIDQKSMKHLNIVGGIITIIIIILSIFVFYTVFKSFNDTNKSKYLYNLDQFDNSDYSFMDADASITIAREDNDTFDFKQKGSIKREKVYLLSKKDSNKVIPIYKSVYSDGETTYTLYIPVIYENIKSGFIKDINNGKVSAPTCYFNMDHSEYAVGYQDLNTLYDEVIKPLENDYNITEK